MFDTRLSTSFEPHVSAAARTHFAGRRCGCGGSPGLDGSCEECRRNRLTSRRESAPAHALGHAARQASGSAGPQGHDFGRVSVLSPAAVNDQTPAQSGGLDEEYTHPPAANVMKQAEGPDIDPGEKPASYSKTPVIDDVELVSSASGAVAAYPEKIGTCDASLNHPGPWNDLWHDGSVANVHQLHFHLAQGDPLGLRVLRIVNRKATARGQTFVNLNKKNATGYDGPPEHEYGYTKDKLVIADAPGWCRSLDASDFPVTYSADFTAYAYDPLDMKILASISYHVEISKTHYSQPDPTNTVTVTAKKIGGALPSPVKPGK